MDALLPWLPGAAGVLIGFLLAWFLFRGRLASDRAVLAERLRNQEARSLELQQQLEQTTAERAEYVERLQAETGRRAAAEEKTARIPDLEQVLQQKDADIRGLTERNSELRSRLSELDTRLEEERRQAAEKLALVDDARQKLADAFKALSADALKSNNQAFLELARETLERFQTNARSDLDTRQKAIGELVRPLKESLEKVDARIGDVEKARTSAYASLNEQIKALATAQTNLQSETANLVKALRSPTVRGRWGEMQLKRVVEMAGMVEYCDFTEQETITGDQGRLRPDMIINLPNHRKIVVDSKAPLQAYLDALEAGDDQTRADKLREHARQIRTHLNQLSSKNYWSQFDATPDFVVLFLPGEMFFSAALQADPKLIEFGVENKVILATPTTLISLLRAVAYGWRQEQIAENARAISNLGRDLYKRIVTLTNHFMAVGKGLDRAVEYYDKAVASLESRVLVSARRFQELGAADDKDIPAIDPIGRRTRAVQVDESAALPPHEGEE